MLAIPGTSLYSAASSEYYALKDCATCSGTRHSRPCTSASVSDFWFWPFSYAMRFQACGWDGGDCCSATGEPGSGGDCLEGTFDCRDGTEEPSVSTIRLDCTPTYLKPHFGRGGSNIVFFVHNYSSAHPELCTVQAGCLPILQFSHRMIRSDIVWVHIGQGQRTSGPKPPLLSRDVQNRLQMALPLNICRTLGLNPLPDLALTHSRTQNQGRSPVLPEPWNASILLPLVAGRPSGRTPQAAALPSGRGYYCLKRKRRVQR